MSKFKDLTGRKFGHWTVLGKAENKSKSGKIKWICQCDCKDKTIKEVIGNNLISGKSTSCGCYEKKLARENLIKNRQSKFIDITGEQFGRLTVLEFAGYTKTKGTLWKCLCECGNTTIVFKGNLTNGSICSCGCLRKESLSKIAKGNSNNLIGKKFGRLKVLQKTQERYNNHDIIWYCLCDCGNYCYASTSSLNKGNKQSCGCLVSKGQQKIIELLTKNNISFESEKSFDSCRFKDTGNKAKFDFYINNHYLIEYDGQQHYSISGYYTEENFQKIQEHDNFKNQWCKENNIPLIRIPYTQFENLCLEDLILETSKFII